MTSSQATCLLCLTMNKDTINFYSDKGKELNIISILSTHFWFQLDKITALSQNICSECWNQTKSFNEFYQSIQIAHKNVETVFVKIEKELDIEDDGEHFQQVPVPQDNFIKEFIKIGNIQEDEEEEDDESSNASVCEVPNTNSIETESRAFDQLPKSTQDKYLRTYDNFMAWKTGAKIEKDCFTEAVMLEYFYSLQSKYKPSSLFAEYSKLRTTIQRNNNVDISYPELTSLLRKNAVGFQSPKSISFEPDQIQKFFSEAKDYQYLASKVILIFLICGTPHADVLVNIDANNVCEEGSVVVIKFADKKDNSIRSFILENEYATCVRKYKQLRPENVPHKRFFLNYRKGKCTGQPIGKNKIRSVPKAVANFLKLEDAENYTCYSFRKRSNKRKIGNQNAEQINLDGLTEATVTSAITGSIDTSTVSTTANNDCENANALEFDVLPEKSREKYLRSYEKFMAWKVDARIEKQCFSKAVMLKYFKYLKTKYKPTSLWAEYSKLRATIQKNCNIDTGYPEVKSFLKTNSSVYLPQKCIAFRPDEITRFLCEAEDKEFLAMKIITIFGIYGVTSASEFTKVSVDDVTEQGSVFVIKSHYTRTTGFRSFTVENEYASYVRKYKQLRPANVMHDRFFTSYVNGKCTALPIGKNKFANIPKEIANFLELRDAKRYKLHSFRIKSLKRGMSTVSDSYIEECFPKKSKIDDLNSENEICEDVTATTWNLLPEKSRGKYVNSYNNFMTWKTDKEIGSECFTEPIMLEYFNYLKSVVMYKPTSLWTEYSKLKATIQKNDNVDISYPELRSFLSNNSSGYLPQKSNVFQSDEVQRFLCEADDFEFLVMKVVTIFGLYGATSVDDLQKVVVNDVREQESVFVIKIQDATNVFRSFVVENEYAAYVRKYKELRPANVEHDRFFINYQNGICSVTPIGKHKFGNMPKVIANFLNLQDVENYTLQSFRIKNKIVTTQWNSSTTVDNCIAKPIANNSKIDDQISQQLIFERSTIQNTSTITSSIVTPTVASASTIPTTCQTYIIQLQPFGTSTANISTDDVYVLPDNR